MEPNLPPLHPKVAALIKELDLRIVDAVKWNLFICIPATAANEDDRVVLKVGADARKAKSVTYETKIYLEVLRQMDTDAFERLTFPDYIRHGEHDGLPWLMTTYMDGARLEHKWSEITDKRDLLGGAPITDAVAGFAVDILRDLRSVDVGSLPAFVARFDLKKWISHYPKKAAKLVTKGFAEKSTIEAASKLLESVKPQRYEPTIFANGDFYPRNFVLMRDGKVALVDWVGTVDVWEFTAMYPWAMMWGNPRWQIAYMAHLKKHFPLDIEGVQLGLLLKSFDQAVKWADMAEETIGFARTQMLSYFRESLDVDYVRGIFGD